MYNHYQQSHFSCKNNESARFSDKRLFDFSLCPLPIRTHFDSKGYVRNNFYGASHYDHIPKLEDFLEDCVDENEVLRRSFMQLTLSQILYFNVSTMLRGDIMDENSDLIDVLYQNVILPAFQ